MKSMMSRSNLSEYLWEEDHKTALYIFNRVLNKSVLKIFFKFWNDRKSNLNYFRIWDYLIKVRIYNLIEKKTNPKTSRCYFIGYLEHAKRYRFYSPGRGDRIVESQIAKFLELDVADVESSQAVDVDSSQMRHKNFQTKSTNMSEFQPRESQSRME